MIKEIKIYNRFNMDTFVNTNGLNFPYKHWHLISIYSSDGEFLNDNAKEVLTGLGMKSGLSLDFWDLTPTKHPDIKKKMPDAIFFDKNYAKKIIDFVDEIQKDKKDSDMVIHCSAGISRSGAVGTFVCDYCGLDYNEFLKSNPYIMSNPYVLRILRRCSGMVPSFDSHDGVDHKFVEKYVLKGK